MSLTLESKKKLKFRWLFELDRILRGEATRPADIQRGDIRIPVVGISVVIILLAIIYGFCMGVFAMVRGFENSQYHQAVLQTFASMGKVPLLFGLTLIVTFPSLYVFNALVGSRLTLLPVLKLLVASLAVNLAVLASLGPILAFFSMSTPNYSFIVLLNVLVFGIAGTLGITFLVQTLNRLTLSRRGDLAATAGRRIAGSQKHDFSMNLAVIPEATGLDDSMPQSPGDKDPIVQAGPLDQLEGIGLERHVRQVFACWIIVFGLVGAQMGWVLRPFIGTPGRPFQWFRARESNFFEAIWSTLQNFLGG